MTNILFKPLGMLMGALGGLLAGVVYKSCWRLVSGERQPPGATREDRSWTEILTAAALEGAIYALVKATFERAGAIGFQKATGTWPGQEEGA